jgi:hypothetical protein
MRIDAADSILPGMPANVTRVPGGADPPDADLSRTYALVVVVEVLVVAALYWLGRYFG